MYHLIIVDDEDHIREGLSECYPWAQLGFTICGSFPDGKAALKYIEGYHVDAILCDIKMPEMDGIELAKEIHQKKLTCQIVFLSGYEEFEYARKAIKYGVKEYILKPADYHEIINVFSHLREALDKQNPNLPIQEDKPEGYYDKIIDKVITYLNEDFQNASLESAALLVSLSPNYLSKIFKRKTTKNFSEYLISVKMNKAADLLKDINLKTYEIADIIGYDNPKNFTRAFKLYHGKTPREFREQGH